MCISFTGLEYVWAIKFRNNMLNSLPALINLPTNGLRDSTFGSTLATVHTAA